MVQQLGQQLHALGVSQQGTVPIAAEQLCQLVGQPQHGYARRDYGSAPVLDAFTQAFVSPCGECTEVVAAQPQTDMTGAGGGPDSICAGSRYHLQCIVAGNGPALPALVQPGVALQPDRVMQLGLHAERWFGVAVANLAMQPASQLVAMGCREAVFTVSARLVAGGQLGA